MANYRLLVPFLVSWEGVNDKNDTIRGVTFDTYKNLCSIIFKQSPSLHHFHSLTNDEVELIIAWFWTQATGGNQIISQKIAETLTTWRWSSRHLGLKWFQEMMNKEYNAGLVTNGIIDKKAVQFINSIDETDLFRKALKYAFNKLHLICEQDPTQQKFLKDWIKILFSFASRHNEQMFFNSLQTQI